jgi:hypothetical protein
MKRSALTRAAPFALALIACVISNRALAQPASAPPSSPPAFALASGHVFATHERPAVMLTFRRVTHLDFRVYRVNDPMAFFARLKDPHVLGSEEPVVPQERTWLERIAAWKADVRDRVRFFVRSQFSRAYRLARRERHEKQQVELRRVVRLTTFAQVPLLNAPQLVTSWREILPPTRDAEARRVPLDLRGPGVYVVEAVNAPLKAYTIVIVSDLGLVTKASPGQVVLFAANRITGEPAPNCAAETLGDQQVLARGTTSADGTWEARFDGKRDDVVALVQCGAQVAASDPGGWYLEGTSHELVGYVYTDKPIYRPGHTVRLKAVLRWRTRGALVPFDRPDVELRIADANDKVVLRETRPVDQYGAVQAAFTVPRGGALGYYTITVATGEQQADGSFEVQEYRKPEFEVTLTPADRFVVQGGNARVTIQARYYFGQPVAGATVQYVAHRQSYYSPYRWSDEADEELQGRWWGGGEEQPGGTVRLDDQGMGHIAVPLPVDDSGSDYSLRFEARVVDASSREVAGNTIVHATFASFLLVADLGEYVYRAGSPAQLRVGAVDYLGTAKSSVKVSAWLEKVDYSRGYEKPQFTKVAETLVQTDAEGAAVWTASLPREAGTYRFKVSTRADDRVISAQVHAWIPGGRDAEDVQGDRYLELIADKKMYAAGDMARFVVRGEQLSTPVLVTKESQEVSHYRVLRPRPGDAIEVPIDERDVGDTWVNVVFMKDDRLYRAEKRVKVPATSHGLQVTITADRPVSRPREPGLFTIAVQDATGRPVPRAQLSFAVIDEAVYGVKADDTPDPLRFFYRREYSRVGTQFSREYSFVGYSGTEHLLLAQRHRPLGLADFKLDRPLQPQVRKEFPDAIFWAGDLVTGGDGVVRAKIAYPDSLTTWRLTARAVTTDTLVGSTTARTTTTKDLIVRAITPRFLTQGDEVSIPVIVHNYLSETKAVGVSVKVEGLAPGEGTAPGPPRVDLAPNAEQRHDWRFRADRVGTATVRADATTEGDEDAVELSLPVQPFGLRRQVAAAGSVAGAGEASADLAIPEDANPAAMSVRVSLAPSLAGSLLGALDFLTSYPYGCTEQTLSSFVPNLLVLRALRQLQLAPTERLQALDRQVREGLKRLYDYQHEDGGWGWWKTDENHPFMTAYALYGLLEARAAGYSVETFRIARGANALSALHARYPRALPELKAYETYVLALLHRDDTLRPMVANAAFDLSLAIDEAWAARERMTTYGRALLLSTLDVVRDSRADSLARALLSQVVRKGELAWWPSDADPLLEDFADTSVEATAMAVKALVARDPRHAVLEPAVRWLLLNRNFGSYWSSTKQTAMVLYGLLDYMRARAETGADFTTEIVVNGKPAGTRRFTAASLLSPDPVVVTVPGQGGANSVRLIKKGGGTLYWSATAEYFERARPIERTGSRKLALLRRYFALSPVQKDKRIVYRETPFTGTASPGDLILVRLTAAGARDWRYLMIEDPLPAGAEPIQQDGLYELEAGRERPGQYGTRREYRDDRVVLFQTSFTEGRYEFTYLLKVITPGVFKAMPAQISPMYVAGTAASSDVQPLTVNPPVAGREGVR